jgi:hypothetical protein
MPKALNSWPEDLRPFDGGNARFGSCSLAHPRIVMPSAALKAGYFNCLSSPYCRDSAHAVHLVSHVSNAQGWSHWEVNLPTSKAQVLLPDIKHHHAEDGFLCDELLGRSHSHTSGSEGLPLHFD